MANVIVFAPICFEQGMAGSKRLGNLSKDIPPRYAVVNLFAGMNGKKTRGHTSLSFSGFVEFYRQVVRLKRDYEMAYFYYYGYPTIQNIHYLLLVHLLGYHLILDIVEDYRVVRGLKKGLRWKIKINVSLLLLKLSRFFPISYVGISEPIIQWLNNYIADAQRIICIPVSVDSELIHRIKKKEVTAGDRLTFFYGGTFAEKDDILILLEAFNLLVKSYSRGVKPRLILTGKASADKISPVTEYIRVNELQESISYLGFLSDADYYHAIHHADILIMPRNNSDFSNTGFPFKLGEYMATGNCTIVARIDSLIGLIHDDEVVFYQPSDIQDLKERMLEASSSEHLRREVGKLGRKRSLYHFSSKNHSKKLIRFLEA